MDEFDIQYSLTRFSMHWKKHLPGWGTENALLRTCRLYIYIHIHTQQECVVKSKMVSSCVVYHQSSHSSFCSSQSVSVKAGGTHLLKCNMFPDWLKTATIVLMAHAARKLKERYGHKLHSWWRFGKAGASVYVHQMIEFVKASFSTMQPFIGGSWCK